MSDTCPFLCSLSLSLSQMTHKLLKVTGPGDLGSIPGQVIPKTQKRILNTQQ